MALCVGDRSLSADQIRAIGSQLQELGVSLWLVDSEHPATRAAAEELGLEVGLPPAGGPPTITPDEIPWEEMAGIVVRRTLRSGQALSHAGHVTLIGDVNPGAEIVAGGDIVVWGKLRGTAHAGAMGSDVAIICALEFAPNQIRIGSHIARPPERSRSPRVPEIASVQDDGIVVERWNKGAFRLEVGSLRLELGA